MTGKIERGSDGDGEVEGKACRKVELTSHGLKPQVLCFDEESGLLAGVEMKTTTPMGEIPVVGTVGGYREVDGVKPPFVLKTKLPGQERVTTVERIAYNQDVPDSRFAAPAALAGGK
ncbi:MAG: hypothetical protein HY822_02980 [Acidobacteria bacterium]|nr:hypothetical protein [Acidobacteriota bacterium]